MTKAQVEVITSVERRRRWPAAEKERLVAASLEAGAVVSAIAREAGITSKPAVWLAAPIVRQTAGGSGFCGGADSCGPGVGDCIVAARRD